MTTIEKTIVQLQNQLIRLKAANASKDNKKAIKVRKKAIKALKKI